MLLVGKAQTLAQPVRVLRQLYRQRGKPQNGIAGKTELGFDGGQATEQPRPRSGGQHEAHEPVVLHGTDELGRARRRQQAQHLLAHPLRRQPLQPFALGDAGGQTFPVGRACAILGR